jgi:sialate O-acetylesterase
MLLARAVAAALLARGASGALMAKLFTNHAVLQRAPAAAVIWGLAPPGTAVDVTLDDAAPLRGIADASGTWRVALPPTAAGGPHTIAGNSSDAGTPPQTITDVLFGEVLLCTGQSERAPRRAAPAALCPPRP